MKSVNILGTEYQILTQKEKDNPKLKEADGLIEPFSKKIILRDMREEMKKDVNTAELAETEHINKVIRHETVHAFFHESGLGVEAEYEHDEVLVDWLAMMGPKIFNCWQELGIM